MLSEPFGYFRQCTLRFFSVLDPDEMLWWCKENINCCCLPLWWVPYLLSWPKVDVSPTQVRRSFSFRISRFLLIYTILVSLREKTWTVRSSEPAWEQTWPLVFTKLASVLIEANRDHGSTNKPALQRNRTYIDFHYVWRQILKLWLAENGFKYQIKTWKKMVQQETNETRYNVQTMSRWFQVPQR